MSNKTEMRLLIESMDMDQLDEHTPEAWDEQENSRMYHSVASIAKQYGLNFDDMVEPLEEAFKAGYNYGEEMYSQEQTDHGAFPPEDDEIQEGWKNPRSWALLPATRILFGKNAIFPEMIASDVGPWEGQSIVVYVVSMQKGWDKWSPAFLVSHGSIAGDEVIGSTQPIHHDQTGASSQVKVENIMTFKGEDMLDQGNGIGVGTKRPIWVFK